VGEDVLKQAVGIYVWIGFPWNAICLTIALLSAITVRISDKENIRPTMYRIMYAFDKIEGNLYALIFSWGLYP